MGWASGSELAERVWSEVRDLIPEAERKRVARRVIDVFEYHDCDTMHECRELVDDAGPDWFWRRSG